MDMSSQENVESHAPRIRRPEFSGLPFQSRTIRMESGLMQVYLLFLLFFCSHRFDQITSNAMFVQTNCCPSILLEIKA